MSGIALAIYSALILFVGHMGWVVIIKNVNEADWVVAETQVH